MYTARFDRTRRYRNIKKAVAGGIFSQQQLNLYYHAIFFATERRF